MTKIAPYTYKQRILFVENVEYYGLKYSILSWELL